MSLRGSIEKQVAMMTPWIQSPEALRLEGSIFIKEVTAKDESILVEGDLLWRAFDKENNECVWEGAEYFDQELMLTELRGDDPFKLDPRITDVTMSDVTEEGCTLKFDVCWLEDSALDNDSTDPEYDMQEETRQDVGERDTTPLVELAQPVENVHAEGSAELIETRPEGIEERLAAAEAAWKEKWEALQNAIQNIPASIEEIPQKTATNMEAAAELSPMPTQEAMPPTEEKAHRSPPYRLKYYRVQAGEDLNLIAERLSASVMKIREMNSLSTSDTEEGTMIRLP